MTDEGRAISCRGFRIVYAVAGPAGAPAIALLHGFGGSRLDWFRQGYVDALAARHRVVAIDLLGHGDSDKPHDAACYQPPLRAADVVAVLDAEGVDTAIVWGYSMGGRNAYAVATYHPERTTGLVVGGSAPETPGADDEPAWLDARADALERGDWPEFWRLVGNPPSAFREPFQARNDPLALAASSRGLRAWPVGSAAELRVPSLHYVGSLDPFAPRVCEAARASGGTLHVLEGHDHLTATTAVDEIVTVVATFVAGLAGEPISGRHR